MNESLKNLYYEFLNTPVSYNSLVCNSCGYRDGHPINYCIKCPGKIVRFKPTYWEDFTYKVEHNHLIYEYSSDFRKWLGDTPDVPDREELSRLCCGWIKYLRYRGCDHSFKYSVLFSLLQCTICKYTFKAYYGTATAAKYKLIKESLT